MDIQISHTGSKTPKTIRKMVIDTLTDKFGYFRSRTGSRDVLLNADFSGQSIAGLLVLEGIELNLDDFPTAKVAPLLFIGQVTNGRLGKAWSLPHFAQVTVVDESAECALSLKDYWQQVHRIRLDSADGSTVKVNFGTRVYTYPSMCVFSNVFTVEPDATVGSQVLDTFRKRIKDAEQYMQSIGVEIIIEEQ
jgi:hypothetical protein